jgi:hypothetical protein
VLIGVIKYRKMRWVVLIEHMGDVRNTCEILVIESEKKTRSRDPGVRGTLISRRILSKYSVRASAGFISFSMQFHGRLL